MCLRTLKLIPDRPFLDLFFVCLCFMLACIYYLGGWFFQSGMFFTMSVSPFSQSIMNIGNECCVELWVIRVPVALIKLYKLILTDKQFFRKFNLMDYRGLSIHGSLDPCQVIMSGFPQALEIMENLEKHQKKFHAWKNHGI